MASILKALSSRKILISDGAWGTFLQAKGLKPGACPELWNLERPEDVFEIAKSYITAGSDVIETNSFGGSSVRLSSYGLEKIAFEINKTSAVISRSAAGKDHFVLGSIGPCGKILMMNEITPSELFDSFSEQAIALKEGGVDAIVIETMTDLEEALIAIRAVKENTDLEVACTMTFDKTVNGEYRTMMGISPSEMTMSFSEAGADIIGTNCGNGMADMAGIVREIKLWNASIPILVHANAGLPVYENGKTVYPESPDEMANNLIHVLEAGASIVGGCCGTTPEHIRKIKAIVAVRIE